MGYAERDGMVPVEGMGHIRSPIHRIQAAEEEEVE